MTLHRHGQRRDATPTIPATDRGAGPHAARVKPMTTAIDLGHRLANLLIRAEPILRRAS
jgi:hypothetical protein